MVGTCGEKGMKMDRMEGTIFVEGTGHDDWQN